MIWVKLLFWLMWNFLCRCWYDFVYYWFQQCSFKLISAGNLKEIQNMMINLRIVFIGLYIIGTVAPAYSHQLIFLEFLCWRWCLVFNTLDRAEEISLCLVLAVWKDFGRRCIKNTQASGAGMGCVQRSDGCKQCCTTDAKLPVLWKTSGE